jgi:hypothetical protein
MFKLFHRVFTDFTKIHTILPEYLMIFKRTSGDSVKLKLVCSYYPNISNFMFILLCHQLGAITYNFLMYAQAGNKKPSECYCSS